MANTVVGGVILDGDGKSFISENNARKEAMLTPMPLYLLDSDNTDVLDFGGVIKTFNAAGSGITTTTGGTSASSKGPQMVSIWGGNVPVGKIHHYMDQDGKPFEGVKYENGVWTTRDGQRVRYSNGGRAIVFLNTNNALEKIMVNWKNSLNL